MSNGGKRDGPPQWIEMAFQIDKRIMLTIVPTCMEHSGLDASDC